MFILGFLPLLLIILARKYLKNRFKMGVQDVQEPFHSATCLKLVKQSAFMIDFGSMLGPLREGFGRLRLPHEPRSLSSKRLKRRFDASGSLKDHFGLFLEVKLYHVVPFWTLLNVFEDLSALVQGSSVRCCKELQILDSARWRKTRVCALDRIIEVTRAPHSYLSPLSL